MIRLFIQFYSGMVLAMLAAGLFIVSLLNNSPNQIEENELKSQMYYVAQAIINRLRKSDEDEWKSVVESYMDHFDDLTLIWRPLEDPELTEDQRDSLERELPVVLDSDENDLQVLLRMPNTETVIGVIQRNPLDNLYPIEILVAGGGALTIIGVVGFLMVFSIVIRLEALQSVSQQLGQGQWSARADSRKPDTIGQLAASFNKMAEQIEHLIVEKNELLQEQRELFQAVAHEFRKPMSRLSFAMDMVVDTEYQQSGINLREDMDESILDLNNLLSEVLRYSRLQPGTPLLTAKPTVISDIIDPIILQQQNLSTKLKFHIEQSSDRSMLIIVDPYYFHRAILNLIRNAVSHAKSEVKIAWASSGDFFFVSIEDDGKGIPVKKRKHIFKPFTRIDPSRSRNSGGMGLGLAIVERISQKHHGNVYVDDSYLGGARFQLTWPINFTGNSHQNQT